MNRPDSMRARFQAADASLDGFEGDVTLASVLNFTAGYLLGAELYQAAAALRRVMRHAGLPSAGLLEALMEKTDVG